MGDGARDFVTFLIGCLVFPISCLIVGMLNHMHNTKRRGKRATMTSANTQIISYSPPSSSKSTHQFTFEVFLSFRGEDTRCGFTDHLYEALISHGIRTFRDDEELERGGIIASELLKAIEESKIFAIILSKNYATSRWCLDELVRISECMAAGQRLILPVFYHVDPSEVRKQEGSYKKAFDDHEEGADEEKREKIQKWRIALEKVGDLAGYDLKNYRYETRLIKEIADVILKELNSKLSLPVSENMVGMKFHLEKLIPLIKFESNDVRMIGIYGLGGIGKTTISKVVYNNIFHLFDSRIFLENVRERSQNYSSRLQLQKEFLNGIIKGKSLEINNIGEGINVIKRSLCSKKVLLILDDVDNSEQLELLAVELGSFGPGSRIIITTRDQHLLEVHEVVESYEVEELEFEESVQLLCQHAFKQNVPKNDYISLLDDVVNYANGLPLALKILGSFLFGKNVLEWESTLQLLEKYPNMDIQKVFKTSYDGLEGIYQEIFLDIACFFKGWRKNDVIRLVEHATIGISVLNDRCLISLSGDTITMHDLAQEMGREIVRHKHPKEPRKWSRLWDPEDISLVLGRKKGTKAIEGIFLDMSGSRKISFTTKAFKRMRRLRLFRVYWSFGFPIHMGMEYQKLLLHEDFEFPSHALRYLHWEGYPLKSLPSNFDGENLIELNLEHSNLKHLWQGRKPLEKLKVLNVSSSQQLTDMPRFSDMPNLEELNIGHCGSLDKVDSSIRYLRKLTLLDLRGCRLIRSLPSTIQWLTSLKSLYLDATAIQELPSSIRHLTLLCLLSARNCNNLRSLPSDICKLKSLEYLDLCGCSNLETFPQITEEMKCLKKLDLSETCIKEFPSSIEFLNHLTSLRLENCENLRSLPSNICRLKFLPDLSLSGCSNLETFPEIMEDMECLEELNLRGTCIKGLPSSIEFLHYLTNLSLEGCKNVRSLPSSICRLKFLKDLSLSGCSNLETFPEIMDDMECLKQLSLNGTGIKELPSSIEFLHRLTYLDLEGCKNLRSLPSNICRLKSLVSLDLIECSNLETFPEIMEDMECLNTLYSNGAGIKELPSSISYLNQLIYWELRHCKNLRSLPSSICKLKSLQRLDLSDCSNLETIPEIMENMECLVRLDLNGTCIKELPSSIEFLNHLLVLSLVECKKLRSLPSSICKLKSLESLYLHGCSNLETFPEIMEDMECLEDLDLSGTGIKKLPSSIGHLNHLIDLNLSQCKNLRSLPSSIGRLKLLKELFLNGCPNLVTEDMEYLPSDLWCLSSLVKLDLSQNNMRHIPAAITQLSNLERLNISHCKMLEEIPELPSSLRHIDAHDCPISNPSTLLWSSLLKWVKKFESPSRYGSINLGGNGIPRWALHQGMGNQIRIELPMNWHEDDHFLGLGFFCLYEPPTILDFYLQSDEEYDPRDEKCRYWDEHRPICELSDTCHPTNGSESDEVWLVYCPKIAIWDRSHSNQYMHLQASFGNSVYNPSKKIKRCGVHPLYSQDHQQNHIWSFDFLCTR